MDTRPKLPCGCCGEPTPVVMDLCDACWEIKHRMGHRMDKVRWHNAKTYTVKVCLINYGVYAPSEYDARVMALCMAFGKVGRSRFDSDLMPDVYERTEIVNVQ